MCVFRFWGEGYLNNLPSFCHSSLLLKTIKPRIRGRSRDEHLQHVSWRIDRFAVTGEGHAIMARPIAQAKRSQWHDHSVRQPYHELSTKFINLARNMIELTAYLLSAHAHCCFGCHDLFSRAFFRALPLLTCNGDSAAFLPMIFPWATRRACSS